MQTNPNDCTVQYVDYPPAGYPRGYYVTSPDYDEIIEGPFATLSEAETAFQKYTENYEPPDPMRGVEFPFADNH